MANFFRADHIGPLVKPQALLTAQQQATAGDGDATALHAAQNAAIQEAIELQKNLLFDFVSDGGFRRGSIDEPYVSSLDGITRPGGSDRKAGAIWSPLGVHQPLTQTRRFARDELQFLRAKTKSHTKISLLSPSSLAVRFFKQDMTRSVYPNVNALAAAFGEIMRREIDALIAEGVNYIQIDCPAYAALFERTDLGPLDLPELKSPDAFEELVAIDSTAIGAVDQSTGATLGMHIGRVEDFDDVSDRYERMVGWLLQNSPVRRVMLEYAAPREHDFTALKSLPPGKFAVLGLVQADDTPDEAVNIMDRLELAARYTSEWNLGLSPRTGFRILNDTDLSMEIQRRTLARTVEVVHQYWGPEA